MGTQQKLSASEVRALFAQYDQLLDVKAAKSAILEKIAKGYGYGPFEQGGERFEIRERKVNGTNEVRFLLRMLGSAKKDTKL
jgi:hypothetical protein